LEDRKADILRGLPEDAIQEMLEKSGFTDIQIQPKNKSREMIRQWDPDKSKNLSDYVVSADLLDAAQLIMPNTKSDIPAPRIFYR
jgi:hypothetical protein